MRKRSDFNDPKQPAMRPRNTGHTHDQHTIRHGAGFIQTMGPGTNYWFTPEDKPN